MAFGLSAASVALIGTTAAVGASLYGASQQADAADSANQSLQNSTNAQIGENRRQYDQTREDFAPYRAAGVKYLGLLGSEMDKPTTAADVMQDPGYQFGLTQGQQALDRKAAAAGGRVSGAALKSASEYATNYATTGYNAAYQRGQDRLNRLAALAGVGQSATGSSAAAGGASSNALTGILDSQGNSNAANTIARGNIWANATNQLGAAGKRWIDGSGFNMGGGGVGTGNGNGGFTDNGITYNNPSAFG